MRPAGTVPNRRPVGLVGDSKPSKTVINWARHGRDNELPAFTTRPQQDHKASGLGITIREEIDRRAQPWNQIVRANVHCKKIRALPPKDATKHQIREYFYLVLTQENLGIAEETPWLVCTTLLKHKGKHIDGMKLRDMTEGDWDTLCPMVWYDIYRKLVHNSKLDRAMVSNGLKETIKPLLEQEKMAEALENKLKLELVKTGELLPDMKTKKRKWYKKMFCFGSADTASIASDESEPLPVYDEKAPAYTE